MFFCFVFSLDLVLCIIQGKASGGTASLTWQTEEQRNIANNKMKEIEQEVALTF